MHSQQNIQIGRESLTTGSESFWTVRERIPRDFSSDFPNSTETLMVNCCWTCV